MHLEIEVGTGKQTLRPYTAEEIAQRQRDMADFEARQAAEEADRQITEGLRASAKAKLIAGEPLTEAEAAVLTI